MAPFPETEIMTLKRLEVALKKSDYKLLKDGTYKLHEKFHSGFNFEYLDLLKDILYNVNTSNVPSDIKDILIPTIEDILSNRGVKTASTTSPYESLNSSRVSSLTSLSYSNTDNEDETEEAGHKINAFDAFGTSKNSNSTENSIIKTAIENVENNVNSDIQNVVQSDIERNVEENVEDKENFEEFSLPSVNSVEIDNPSYEEVEGSINEFQNEPQKQVETFEIPKQEFEENKTLASFQNSTLQTFNNDAKTKTLSIFLAQNNSDDKNKNILRYKELISKINIEQISLGEIISLISNINTQSNTNVAEIAGIFEQIQNRSLKINLITNSTNANLVALLENIKIPYKLNSNEEKVNVLPLFGLSNLFKCAQCGEEFLDTVDKINPFVLQCPKCKSAMFPNYSCAYSNFNLEYYNNAIVNFANSDVWFVLNPSGAEKIMLDMMRAALKLNKQVKEIFIADKDINTKETYKTAFNKINPNIKINIDISALEEFLKTI